MAWKGGSEKRRELDKKQKQRASSPSSPPLPADQLVVASLASICTAGGHSRYVWLSQSFTFNGSAGFIGYPNVNMPLFILGTAHGVPVVAFAILPSWS
ncbi:hypothetical protein BJ684DRAFT_21114 [Piptocephalis cylindrospora]|uniref:Uncharacterized protein n=1 Tax=Piptocephalis cylindrospora TaxID=1907219 RepID=A0A4P9Y3D3_9FUNG|nr:hypothetical protein BJ684DRAFT_21114 [Piptocephalis cylindrospora]|eukprot:RKP12340.1 hypothetical protein BJ684DRAFT_21114 [Piptocephalis cylindrospora]